VGPYNVVNMPRPLGSFPLLIRFQLIIITLTGTLTDR